MPETPKLFVEGELIGGYDEIISEYRSGRLQQKLMKAGAMAGDPLQAAYADGLEDFGAYADAEYVLVFVFCSKLILLGGPICVGHLK